VNKFFISILNISPSSNLFHFALLFFRAALSSEMILVHGLKKLGLDGTAREVVPNPFHFPTAINQVLVNSADLLFPPLVLLGVLTRLSVIPILTVTLTGYFIIHWHDALPERDTPFMYSLSFLLILFLGPGKYSIDNAIHKTLTKN